MYMQNLNKKKANSRISYYIFCLIKVWISMYANIGACITGNTGGEKRKWLKI